MAILERYPGKAVVQNEQPTLLEDFFPGGRLAIPDLADAFIPFGSNITSDKKTWASVTGNSLLVAPAGSDHSNIAPKVAGDLPYIQRGIAGEGMDGWECPTGISGFDWSADQTAIILFRSPRPYDGYTFDGIYASQIYSTSGPRDFFVPQIEMGSNRRFKAYNPTGVSASCSFRYDNQYVDDQDGFNWGVIEYDASAGTVAATINGFGAAYSFVPPSYDNAPTAGATSDTPGGLLTVLPGAHPIDLAMLMFMNTKMSDPANSLVAAELQAFLEGHRKSTL